jgi:uncharacterized membrane protein YphA (DoxX/SURF4 family)
MNEGWPASCEITNRGELAVLYCFIFRFIAARGPGALSVDGKTA